MMHGYHGRYLRVDLSTRSSTWISLNDDVLRRFIGGAGLGTWLLHRECPPRVEPLAPEAPLIFSLSPLVGTPLTTSAKFAVLGKSPLTNRLNDALSSSHFALSAKKAGMDALVIVGRSDTPVVLVIDDGAVRFEDASPYWGRSAKDTHTALSTQLGTKGDAYHMACIGVAGENQVRYATISHDNRHAGRGGLGAGMGSKNLKAIAVRGTQRVSVADPDAVIRAARDLSQRSFGPATAKYRELGTVANLLTFNRLATLPTRNFQQSTFEDADKLSGEGLNSARRVARQSCAACTIGCEHIYKSSTGPVRLEYESLFALGSLCGIGDPDVVLRAAKLCDDYGLDTISTGATIAFAMECAEKGLIDDPELRFGNAERMLRLIEEIAHRRGLGDLLADGTRLAAQQVGGESSHFAPHIKGLELPGYEPRTLQTMALGLAVGSRGADHNRSGAYEVDFSPRVDRLHGTPDAAHHAIETEDKAALMDSLILCKFLRGVFTDFVEEAAQLLRLVTGWDVTGEELHQTVRRIVTAKKLFNIREGWTAAEDTLPGRFLQERLMWNEDAATLPVERLKGMIAAYYHERGWDEYGMVPGDIVAKLDLMDLA